MDTEQAPLENIMALEKAIRTNDRAVRQGGFGDSDHALWLARANFRLSRTLLKKESLVRSAPRDFSGYPLRQPRGFSL